MLRRLVEALVNCLKHSTNLSVLMAVELMFARRELAISGSKILTDASKDSLRSVPFSADSLFGGKISEIQKANWTHQQKLIADSVSQKPGTSQSQSSQFRTPRFSRKKQDSKKDFPRPPRQSQGGRRGSRISRGGGTSRRDRTVPSRRGASSDRRHWSISSIALSLKGSSSRRTPGPFCKRVGKKTQDRWVLSVERRGYKIPFVKKPTLSPSPQFFKQSGSPVLEEEVQKLLQKRAVESINLEDPGFYSRIFLVPKRNGKWRLIIDLSRLNKFLNIQSFSMETVWKQQTRSGMRFIPKIGWYRWILRMPIFMFQFTWHHGNISDSEGSSVSVQGTSVWPGYKSFCHSNTSQSSSNYSVSILDDWLVRNQCRLELIKDKEFTSRLITSLGLIINQEKSN